MTTERAIKILDNYNKWLVQSPSLSSGVIIIDNVPNQREVGKAISKVIEVVREVENDKIVKEADSGEK